MKKFILISFVSLLMFSCRKENNSLSPKPSYLSNVIAGLKDSLSDNDFSNISTKKVFITKINSSNYLRIPFKGRDISKDFILLQTDRLGKIVRGFIINLSRSQVERGKEYQYNGFITKSSLDRKFVKTSSLTNGVITHSHSGRYASRDSDFPDISFPVPKDTTIIIVTGDIPTYGDAPISYSDWISITGIIDYSGYYGADGAYLFAGYYNPSGSAGSIQNGEIDPATGQYNGDTFHLAPVFDLTGVDLEEANPLLVDIEPSEDLSPIDVNSFLKCFSNIPNEGSTCSIEIMTDIPVDNDPNKLFNWQTQSPGHTFLQLKKTSGNQSVMQNIGFYPLEGWKTILTTAPVTGKFVDNGQHEYNASLTMNLTPEEMQKTLIEITYLSGFVKYDIDEFNCTDFALDVFNTARISNPIEIPKYDIPGGTAPNGSNTPQGLYNKLKDMQALGVESNNITIPGYKGFVAPSNGPCN